MVNVNCKINNEKISSRKDAKGDEDKFKVVNAKHKINNKKYSLAKTTRTRREMKIIVSYTEKGESIRIISSREAKGKERKNYEEKR